MRVVSLVPSVTETLLAWGVDVVACTRFCEQPLMHHVGGTKDPDIAAIVELAPDVVVVDREENRRDDALALEAAGVAVHVTHVVDVAGVPAMLDDLAAAVGHTPYIAGSIELPEPVPRWSTAATLIWRRPWMTIGPATYGSSLLEHLGIANAFDDTSGPAGAEAGEAGEAGEEDGGASAATYPEITLDDIAARAPTFVILPSEPYSFAERHVAPVADAVPGAHVVLLDGRDLFWWGTRTPGALGRVAAALSLRS